jgi:outer membrane lipoprotein carrier protein
MLHRSRLVGAAVVLMAALALLVPSTGQAAVKAPATAGSAAARQQPTPLDRYLKSLKTLRVTFLQTVADAHGAQVGRSTGTLTVARPGKFRWDIQPQSVTAAAGGASAATQPAAGSGDSGQLMVCDGRNLWYYDRDLQQVTVRPVSAALSATPAMLLSGTVDVHEHFKERSAGTRDGLDWVYVEPRSAQADFKSALFGFDGKGALRRMILQDKLGQIVTIVFHDVQVNVPVPPHAFEFTVPPGADLIGTPAQ